MAAQRLCGHIYLFLLTSFLVGGAKTPCEKQLRSRKPLLESLQWDAYWVPLMIILGGCCAMAWSILFIAYDVSRLGKKALPQIPGAQEEEQKERDPRQVPPKERKEDSHLLESKNSKELFGTSLKTKGSREEIELDRTGSRDALGRTGFQDAFGNPQKSEESKATGEGTENSLEIKRAKEGIENQAERRGSQEGIDSLFLRGENDPTSFRPDQVKDQPCGKLWSTMEKELERLLQLLRFCQSSGPGPLAEGTMAPAVEEAMPPPAVEAPNPPEEETPQPTQAQEPPTIPAEENPRPPGAEQSQATVQLIICGIPCSSRSNRGQRKQGGSRGCK